MADYYSLLAKLLDGLADATAATRQGVYDRARRALAEQLRNVTPPLTDAEIEREGHSLEDAIGQLEAHYRHDPVQPAPELPIEPEIARPTTDSRAARSRDIAGSDGMMAFSVSAESADSSVRVSSRGGWVGT